MDFDFYVNSAFNINCFEFFLADSGSWELIYRLLRSQQFGLDNARYKIGYVDTGGLDFRTLYKSFSDYDIRYCVIVIRPFKLIIIVTVGMYIKNEIWSMIWLAGAPTVPKGKKRIIVNWAQPRRVAWWVWLLGILHWVHEINQIDGQKYLQSYFICDFAFDHIWLQNMCQHHIAQTHPANSRIWNWYRW